MVVLNFWQLHGMVVLNVGERKDFCPAYFPMPQPSLIQNLLKIKLPLSNLQTTRHNASRILKILRNGASGLYIRNQRCLRRPRILCTQRTKILPSNFTSEGMNQAVSKRKLAEDPKMVINQSMILGKISQCAERKTVGSHQFVAYVKCAERKSVAGYHQFVYKLTPQKIINDHGTHLLNIQKRVKKKGLDIKYMNRN